MFRFLNRRTLAGTGCAALCCALLGICAPAFAASGRSAAPESATPSQTWKTHVYSRTSEFAQRLTLLEFSEKNNPACEPTTKLLNEMRRKNYPIQRVDRAGGGDVLFTQYKVETVPTLVLLMDGREFGRVVVRKDDLSVTTKRLLALFQKGRDAVAANPRPRVREPEYISQAKPALGFLFPHALDDAVRARAQAPDAVKGDSPASVDSEVSILDSRTEEISNLIGEARLEAASVRVLVGDPNGAPAREGAGSAIHYNAQYRETLMVVASGLFAGISSPTSYPDVTVEIYNAETKRLERVGGQCVHCDPDAGVAFVAAQVEGVVKPVAFLPKKSPLEPGERAVSFTRRGDDVVKKYHDVFAVDQRRFYENSDEQSAFVSYVEVSNPPEANDVGAGLYVQRNGRYYFAGLFVSGNAKGCVAPAPAVSQELLVNRNLTAVYRDQIANRFDTPATDAEIDDAIDRLMKLDAQKVAAAPASSRPSAYAVEETPNVTVSLSEPVASDAPAATAEVDLAVGVPTASTPEAAERVDVAFSSASGDESDASNFPNNAQDAFARSDALASALSENASFQIADAYRQNDVAAPSAAAPVAESTAPAMIAPEVASATRSQLAFNDQPTSTPQVDAAALPVASAPAAVSAPVSSPLNDAERRLAALDASFPEASAAPLDDPFPTPTTDVLPTAAPVVAATEPVAPTAVPAPVAVEPSPVAERLVAQSAPAAIPTSSPYAADPLPTPNSELIRSTTFSNREQLETFNQEEDAFEAALDALRRRGMEGAEIICIVNWSDASGSRESEVVRIPRRTVLTNPSAPGAGVQLAQNPDATRASERASVAPVAVPEAQNATPMTSNLPDTRLYK